MLQCGYNVLACVISTVNMVCTIKTEWFSQTRHHALWLMMMAACGGGIGAWLVT